MTAEVTQSYTDEQQAIALAALERYGLRPSGRFLAELWGHAPHTTTLLRWRANAVATVTDEHRDFWADYDKSVQTEVKQRVAGVYNKVMDTIEFMLEDPKNLERVSKVNGLSIAGGIWFDKVFPQAKPGYGGVQVNGDNAQVVLQVVMAPDQSMQGEARPPMREV